MHIFHKWSKWESYETINLSSFYGVPCKTDQVRQKRSCEICGYTEDDFVSAKNFIMINKNNLQKDPM